MQLSARTLSLELCQVDLGCAPCEHRPLYCARCTQNRLSDGF